MKLLERILLTTDFSESSDDALKMAILIAEAFKSEIHLLHVVPEVEDVPFKPTELKQMMQKQLEKVQAKIQEGNIEVKSTFIGSGDPSLHISQQADLHDVNLIVIGSGNETVKRKDLWGITAERVIRRANKPVFMVKHGTPPVIQKILCPVDFSPASDRALRNAVHLARRLRAQLSVVTVVEPLKGIFMSLGKASQKDQEAYSKQKERRFAQFLKGIDFHRVEWSKTILSGEPHREILRLARDQKPDIIVMGALGATESPKVALGKVAEKVLQELPCSIVTVKSEDPIRLQLEQNLAQIKALFLQGQELLEHGFAEEAAERFQSCIDKDDGYVPAWEGLAAAQERLGNAELAERSRAKAKEIRYELWKGQVEAEIRGRYWTTL